MKKTISLCVLFASAFTGCAKLEEAERLQNSEATTIQTLTRAGAAPVFEHMENPYELSLMRELKNNPSLQPTHIYGRFLPQDSTQLNRLENTLDLDLFDYPLDVNIEDGEVYVDPTIPEGEITWQYVVVPANFVFPSGITWNKITDCYIPNDSEVTPPGSTRAQPGMNLEEAAILACGYVISAQTRAGGDGRPNGTVTVRDNSRNRYEPVKGVRVKCHYFMKSGRDYTDANGNYSISTKFRVQPKYTVVFRNEKDFVIWNWAGHRAKYKVGRHNQSGYDIQIETATEGWAWAAINNGAYDYYRMCETTGIAKPPKQLKILDTNDVMPGSSAPMIRRFPAGNVFTHANWITFLNLGTGGSVQNLDRLFKFIEPDILIDTDTDYLGIYCYANHELSHASHFQKAGAIYWGSYVDHIIDHGFGYGSGGGNNAGYCEVGEMWGYALEAIQENKQFSPASLEDRYPGRTVAGWINPAPIWALITRGVLSEKQIFDCLTSDVNTVDKLINKLCVGKTTAVADMIRTAFAHDDVPVISGPDAPTMNTNVTYSVPASLGTDFTFVNWTPTGGATINNPNSRTTTVIFPSYGTSTLTANFTLPGNVAYPVTKTFNLAAPAVSLSANKSTVVEGSTVVFSTSVTPTSANVTSYQWELNGQTTSGGASYTVITTPNTIQPFALQPQPGTPLITMRCRALIGSTYTPWSNMVSVPVIQ